MAQRGIPPHRVLVTKKDAWVDHIRTKSAADLVLDTFVKNGHTSVADALWAGTDAMECDAVYIL